MVGTHLIPASLKRAIIFLSGPRPKLTAATFFALTVPPANLERIGTGGVAVERAPEDALPDRGQAEHIIRKVEFPMGGLDPAAVGALAIGSDIFALRRNAERGQIVAGQTSELLRP